MNENELTVKRYNESTKRKTIKENKQNNQNNIIENSSSSSVNLRNINKCTKKKNNNYIKYCYINNYSYYYCTYFFSILKKTT